MSDHNARPTISSVDGRIDSLEEAVGDLKRGQEETNRKVDSQAESLTGMRITVMSVANSVEKIEIAQKAQTEVQKAQQDAQLAGLKAVEKGQELLGTKVDKLTDRQNDKFDRDVKPKLEEHEEFINRFKGAIAVLTALGVGSVGLGVLNFVSNVRGVGQ